MSQIYRVSNEPIYSQLSEKDLKLHGNGSGASLLHHLDLVGTLVSCLPDALRESRRGAGHSHFRIASAAARRSYCSWRILAGVADCLAARRSKYLVLRR